MTYELTKEEKTNAINGRLKNLEFAKFDLELSIEEENSLVSPDAQIVARHQASIANIDRKKTALEDLLADL